jgi:hypothetical protein
MLTETVTRCIEGELTSSMLRLLISSFCTIERWVILPCMFCRSL